MPCSSMFILEIAQTPPLFSWPARRRLRGSPPCSSTYSLDEDQHAARARARVVDAHALAAGSTSRTISRTTARGRVELAALLAGRVGEVADQVLVGGAEQVGELEVLVAQPVPC